MKVVFDSQIFLLQKYGGISRYYTCLYEQLKFIGVDSKILAPLSVNHYYNSLHRDGVFRIKSPLLPPLVNKALIYLFDLLLPCSQPDIIHRTFYYGGNFPYFPFLMKNIPRVLTVYDLIDELYFSQRKTHKKLLAAKRHAISSSDHIIAISENTKLDLMKYYTIPENKISVTYLSAENFTSIDCSSVHVPLPSNFFLFVGSRSSYKNFHLLVKCLLNSCFLKNNISLIAFGGGALNSDENLLLAPLLEKKLFLHFKGDDCLLKYLYQNALALVYPSAYEGFGIPPLEAMSVGCPVICSNTSSLPEVVGDSALTFDPSDEHQLVSILDSLANDSGIRSSLIRMGYKRSNLFSWPKTALQTKNVYSSLI